MIGTMLASRYQIRSQLGEGGMAIVYKAMDVLLHRTVAIKVLRPQYAGDEEFVERFRREAQAAASLSHPNVVNIFDVGEADDVHYIVLEYVQGQNLKEIVRKEGRLIPRRAVRIAAAVARALQAAHDRGLVHRDIKPHNILITSEGRVKVTDFGIARATSRSTLTEAGMVVGSVHYFSPEQARGQAVGPAADLYSLGVVLYEMLTGQVPFTGDSPVSVALQHLEQTPRPLREISREIPVWLERVVLKALAKEPEGRYRSAAAMAADLSWRGGPRSDVQSTSSAFDIGGPAGSAGRSDPDFPSDATDAEKTRIGPSQLSGAKPHATATFGDAADLAAPTTRLPSLSSDGNTAALSSVSDERPPGDHSAAAVEEDEGKRRSNRLIRWVIIIALLGGFGFGVYAGLPVVLEMIFPPEVDVPQVVGLTFDEARPLMQEAGLPMNVEAEVFDRHIPEGAIVRQNPDGGRTVRKGREIGVVLSRGPEYGQVPDVTGRSVRDARVLLTQAGYTLGEEIEQPDDTLPANQIVSQEPVAGTEVEKGTPITLWVSKLPEVVVETVVVPDFRGKTLAAAKAELAELGLETGNEWAEINLLVPPGRVIDQNPAAGTVVDVGDDVDFVYSEGLVGSGRSAERGPAPGREEQRQHTPEPTETEDAERDVPEGDLESDSAFRFPFEEGAEPPADDGDVERDAEAEDFADEVHSQPEADVDDGEDTDWEAVLQAESGDSGRRWANVDVYIPPGSSREVVVLVIDDFGVREALRQMVPGDTELQKLVDGRGDRARLQVYIDGVMQIDEPFPN